MSLIYKEYKKICLIAISSLLISCNSPISETTSSTVEDVQINSAKETEVKTDKLEDVQKYQVRGNTVLVASCAVNIQVDLKEFDSRIKNPCADKPVSVDIFIEKSDGTPVSQLKSSEIGEFSIELATGNYLFKVNSSAFMNGTELSALVDGPKNLTLRLNTKAIPVK